MSKAVGGFGLFRAQRDAQLVLERIRPHVIRAEVAGSVRRRRPTVHDLDVVVVLDPDDPWKMRGIEQALGDMLAADGASGHPRYRLVKEGPSIVSFVQEGKNAHTQGWVPFGPNLDLYIATPETWGITLLIRTGSAAHNVKLTQVAAKMLPARKVAVSQGVLDTAGQVIASRTEEEIFGALRMRWLDPEQREAPEYESWIRDGAAG